MANASDLIAGRGAFARFGSLSATGTGWVIDPDTNTTGINVSTIVCKHDHYTNKYRVGGDKVTIENNVIFCTGASDVVTFSGLYLPPGVGLYVAPTEGPMTVVYDPA